MDTYQRILTHRVIPLNVDNYLIILRLLLVVVIITVCLLSSLPCPQLLLLLPPLVLLCLLLPLGHGAIRHRHERVLRQWGLAIHKDESLLLVPLSQYQHQEVGSSIKKEARGKKTYEDDVPQFQPHWGRCPGTGYTNSRIAPASSHEGSITSMMCCATSEGESAPSVSTVPSSDAPGAIMCRGSARLISGATLRAWYSPMIPDPFTPLFFKIWTAARWY